MRDWRLPIEGSCRCGEVKLKIGAPPMITMACHCTGCQKMTSSAFSLSAAFPTEAVEVIAGEPVLGGMKREVRHFFCPSCMSWMFSRMDGLEWFTNVRSGVLLDPQRFAPFIEAWTDEQLPFAQTGAAKSYPQFPPMEEFEPLTKAFADAE